MTLEDYAKIVTSIGTILILCISVIIAFLLYRWQRESSKIDTVRKLHDDLSSYTRLVLENEDLQELEAKNHRWGALSKEEVVKMYRYFLLFNSSYSVFEARNKNAIRLEMYLSEMNNVANMTYEEREFIKKHVFPRGYENGFRKCILDLWAEIDKSG
ncbi:MAG: hypothetical protein V3U87_05370, partial [Methylococcaceae bacterium]